MNIEKYGMHMRRSYACWRLLAKREIWQNVGRPMGSVEHIFSSAYLFLDESWFQRIGAISLPTVARRPRCGRSDPTCKKEIHSFSSSYGVRIECAATPTDPKKVTRGKEPFHTRISAARCLKQNATCCLNPNMGFTWCTPASPCWSVIPQWPIIQCTTCSRQKQDI